MINLHLFIIIIILIYINIINSYNKIYKINDNSQISCRQPATQFYGGNIDRKFLLLGHVIPHTTGLGNLLAFYPAAYYFAVISNRDIIINDNTTIAEMCNIIQCNFPLLSEMIVSYPDIFDYETLTWMNDMNFKDFQTYALGNYSTDDERMISAYGYNPRSDWWIFFNDTVDCVSVITGCIRRDIMCAERFAYQQLIRGPIKRVLTNKMLERLNHLPETLIQSIFTLPHAYVPRIDISLHLRLQFEHFEGLSIGSDPEFIKEVNDWLNTEEAKQIYDSFEYRITELIHQINTKKFIEYKNNKWYKKDPLIYIYVSSDDETVKRKFANNLQNNILNVTTVVDSNSNISIVSNIKVMYLMTDFILHGKNIELSRKFESQNDTISPYFDLAFDWYCLSLSNHLLAYRKGYSLSTFAYSAYRLSGSINYLDRTLKASNGMGTVGELMSKKNYVFHSIWSYPTYQDKDFK